jgi:uncharacterized damage-inducible protein DinB
MRDRALLGELQREWDGLGGRLGAAPPAFRRGGPPFPLTGPGLFAELEEVRALWRELRRVGLSGHARKYVNAGWTLQDLLAHLASWAAEFRRQVETIAAGRDFDYAIPFALSVIGPNAWNEEQVEARRGLSLKAVLDQFDDETRRLQDLVLTLPREVLLKPATLPLAPSGDPRSPVPGNVALVASAKCTHDRHHIGQISRWLAAREADRKRPSTRGRRSRS